jgi:hypothetical protein
MADGDIVERLRDSAGDLAAERDESTVRTAISAMYGAADEITCLRSELAEAREKALEECENLAEQQRAEWVNYGDAAQAQGVVVVRNAIRGLRTQKPAAPSQGKAAGGE